MSGYGDIGKYLHYEDDTGSLGSFEYDDLESEFEGLERKNSINSLEGDFKQKKSLRGSNNVAEYEYEDDFDYEEEEEEEDEEEDDDHLFKLYSNDNRKAETSALSSINNNDNIKINLYSYSRFTVIQFIHQVLFNIAKEISLILNLSQSQTLYLLIHFKWNSESLIEKYMDKYDALLEEIGVPKMDTGFLTTNGYSKSNPTLGQLQDHGTDFVCPICCDDDEESIKNTKKFALRCGHFFCQDCYKHYINDQIPAGGLIKCPEYDCNIFLQLEDLNVLFYKEYQEFVQTTNMENKKKSRIIRKKYRRLFKHYHPVSFGSFVGDKSDSESHNSSNSDEEEEEDTPGQENEKTADDSDSPKRKSFVADFYDDVSDNEEFIKLVKEKETLGFYQKSYEYLRSVATKYIESHRNVHWCPAPDCDTLVQFKDYIPSKEELQTKITQLPIITCIKEHNFCVNCKYESHFPVPCYVVETWVEKCSNDSETANWINLNTKQCPKCHSSIEKNGGCNHMTCNKCSHQFCWICLGAWNLHANEYYNCNRYDDTEMVETRNNMDMVKKNYTKYLHYFDRFQIHQVSMNQDLKIYEKITKKIKLLQKTQGISWIEGQFLKNSISTLLKARNTLKWSYAFSYHLRDIRTNSALIFEQNQTILSNAVEDLSKLFELDDPKKIMAHRLHFIQKARFCVSRQLSLISCAEEGLIKNALVFDLEADNDPIAQVKKPRKGRR